MPRRNRLKPKKILETEEQKTGTLAPGTYVRKDQKTPEEDLRKWGKTRDPATRGVDVVGYENAKPVFVSVEAHIYSFDGNVYDVTDDIIGGSFTRRMNAASSLSISISNEGDKYRQRMIPNDRIVLWVTRESNRQQAFTGYITNTPMFNLVDSREINLECSDIIIRLGQKYWDANLPENILALSSPFDSSSPISSPNDEEGQLEENGEEEEESEEDNTDGEQNEESAGFDISAAEIPLGDASGGGDEEEETETEPTDEEVGRETDEDGKPLPGEEADLDTGGMITPDMTLAFLLVAPDHIGLNPDYVFIQQFPVAWAERAEEIAQKNRECTLGWGEYIVCPDDSDCAEEPGEGGEGEDVGKVGEYPGDDASQAEKACWMGTAANNMGLPPELPVTVSMHEHRGNMQNIPQNGCEYVEGQPDFTGFAGCAGGYFQQTPSAGWGTADQVMDPEYALGKFLEAANQYKDNYPADPSCEEIAAWGQDVQKAGVVSDMPGWCEKAVDLLAGCDLTGDRSEEEGDSPSDLNEADPDRGGVGSGPTNLTRTRRQISYAEAASNDRYNDAGKYGIEGSTVTTEFNAPETVTGTGLNGKHAALDIAAPEGTPIHAVYPGTATHMGGALGNPYTVCVNYGEYTALYLHNSKFGQEGEVEAGDIIAYVGSTGYATGPHSHLAVDTSCDKIISQSGNGSIDPEQLFGDGYTPSESDGNSGGDSPLPCGSGSDGDQQGSTDSSSVGSENDYSFGVNGGFILSPYGAPSQFNDEGHTGVDIFTAKNEEGSAIKALGSGYVLSAGEFSNGCGDSTLIVKYDGGPYTLYCHDRDMNVRTGQRFKRNQVLGHVGCEGNCQIGSPNYPHTHITTSNDNRIAQDPLLMFERDLVRIDPAIALGIDNRGSHAMFQDQERENSSISPNSAGYIDNEGVLRNAVTRYGAINPIPAPRDGRDQTPENFIGIGLKMVGAGYRWGGGHDEKLSIGQVKKFGVDTTGLLNSIRYNMGMLNWDIGGTPDYFNFLENLRPFNVKEKYAPGTLLINVGGGDVIGHIGIVYDTEQHVLEANGGKGRVYDKYTVEESNKRWQGYTHAGEMPDVGVLRSTKIHVAPDHTHTKEDLESVLKASAEFNERVFGDYAAKREENRDTYLRYTQPGFSGQKSRYRQRKARREEGIEMRFQAFMEDAVEGVDYEKLTCTSDISASSDFISVQGFESVPDDKKVKYKIESKFKDISAKACSQWNSPDGITFEETNGSDYDLVFRDGSADGRMAVTRQRTGSPAIVEYNAATVDSYNQDGRQMCATHEVGHFIGMDHEDGQPSVMKSAVPRETSAQYSSPTEYDRKVYEEKWGGSNGLGEGGESECTPKSEFSEDLSGSQPYVAQSGNFLDGKFPGIKDIGGIRPGDPQDHGTGHALDLMVSELGTTATGEEEATGQSIVDYLYDEEVWKAHGVKYLIWQRHITMSAGGSWDDQGPQGSPTVDHMDHVHVSYVEGGGEGDCFPGGGGSGEGGDGESSSDGVEEVEPCITRHPLGVFKLASEAMSQAFSGAGFLSASKRALALNNGSMDSVKDTMIEYFPENEYEKFPELFQECTEERNWIHFAEAWKEPYSITIQQIKDAGMYTMMTLGTGEIVFWYPELMYLLGEDLGVAAADEKEEKQMNEGKVTRSEEIKLYKKFPELKGYDLEEFTREEVAENFPQTEEHFNKVKNEIGTPTDMSGEEFDATNASVLTAPILLSEMDLVDFSLYVSDEHLVTHYNVLGSYRPWAGATPPGGIIDLKCWRWSTIFDHPLFYDNATTTPHFDAAAFIQRYGVRSVTEQVPYIKHVGMAQFYAEAQLLRSWLNCYILNLQTSFLPEAYPGQKIIIESLGIECMIIEATHTFGGSWSTQLAVSMPLTITDNSKVPPLPFWSLLERQEIIEANDPENPVTNPSLPFETENLDGKGESTSTFSTGTLGTSGDLFERINAKRAEDNANVRKFLDGWTKLRNNPKLMEQVEEERKNNPIVPSPSDPYGENYPDDMGTPPDEDDPDFIDSTPDEE